MPRILYDPTTTTLITWPRGDDDDVVGLQPPVVMLWIEQSQPPTDYDPAVYGLQPTQDVDLDALVLRRGWELVALPPPPPVVPTARWVQFAGALAADPAVNGLVATAATTAPVLHLMLGVGLGQAAQGDPATFLAAWAQAVSGGLVAPELVAQMQALAGGFDLPAAFVDGLGGAVRPAAEYMGQEWMAPDGGLWRVEQSRGDDGQFLADDPATADRESLQWTEVV